eukprot:TRINITY_DN7174_c0_g1_i1.p1 TRINITY_DN7174_c0_g1~~TRINITY_DN7174_c0_g1_i1.p1  ORF type:complete len:220 (-),score=58.76 TRINITY_DN7174_c0_g1_i1:356-1015(-)
MGKGHGSEWAHMQYFTSLRTGKIPSMIWSLRYGGVNITTRDEKGFTGLHIAANDRPKVLDSLLDYLKRSRELEYVDINDNFGRSPLIIAAIKGSFPCVRMLVDFGADYKKHSEEGLTAEEYAKKHGFKEIAEFLKDPEGYKAREQAKAEAEASLEDDKDDKKDKKYKFLAPEKREAPKKKDEEEDLPPSDLAIWPEVKRVLEERRRDISIVHEGAEKWD